MSNEYIEKAQLLAWLECYRGELDADTIRSFEDLMGIERVKHMALEERIKNALDKCAMSGWRLSVLQTEIACVAQAAVEEDRKSRECCNAEREACAGIVEEEYRQSLLRNDPNPGIDPLLTATKIRAHKSKGD